MKQNDSRYNIILKGEHLTSLRRNCQRYCQHHHYYFKITGFSVQELIGVKDISMNYWMIMTFLGIFIQNNFKTTIIY